MKIEVWFDFACPSCYVGNKTLEIAIEYFGKDKFIQTEYKSFQLEPNVKNESTEKVLDVLQRKYQLSVQKKEELQRDLIEKADQIGLNIDLVDTLSRDTYDAHRLVKFAERVGKDAEIIERIYHKFFSEKEDIGEKSTLLSIAKQVGLDEIEAETLLSFNKYEKAVLEDQMTAEEMGIKGVPFLIFNNTYAVSGVQPPSVYINLLQDIWEEDPICFEDKRINANKTYCEGNDCDKR